MYEINAYIAGFPKEIRPLLEQVRNAVKKAVPKAEECISWGMPTYKQNGNVVHFAGHKTHVGFYPGPSGIDAFKEELSDYKTSKGAVQFPFDKPIPLKLIAKIATYRAEENEKAAMAKRKATDEKTQK